MENLKLGEIIQEDRHRDAIHVAIAPVIAAARLSPGQHIGIVDGGVGPTDKNIGIVDPFLRQQVSRGQRFWMFLYPNTITSLRHEWTHPAFYGETLVASMSEAWLRNFAEEEAGISYRELMDGAAAYLRHGDYLCEGGRWEGFYVPDELWDHYEAVTGVKPSTRGSFFSCSC